jgi:hypothetical protein
MKKIIILILTIFLLSGCSVEYNLEINNDNIRENIEIGKFDASEIEDFEYLTPYAILNDESQKFYVFDYSNKILNLSYDYNIQNYEMSEAFNQCYDMSNFSYDEKYYYILTSNEFKCLSYMGYTTDEVKINIKSRYKVVESNADYVDNGVYTWIINEGNKDNKPINITIDYNETIYKGNKLSSFSVMLLVIVSLLIVGMIVGIIFLCGKKNNKI